MSNWTFPPNMTEVPIPAVYNCGITQSLPFGGAEILILESVFLFLAVMTCVTFIDVAVKQTWPSTFLSSAAQKRIADLQAAFPNLAGRGSGSGKTATAEEGSNSAPAYTRVVNQAPYIASLTVDDDLVEVLANGAAFSTVSSYCSCTVRGYAMVTGLLLTAAVTTSMLWLHNAMVYPASVTYASYISLVGYGLISFTGIVMIGPTNYAVYRQANICLWGSVSKNSKLINLHDIGVVSFVLLPWASHIYTILTTSDSMPNRTGAIVGVVIQISGALVMACGKYGGKIKGYTRKDGACVSIIGEIICVFSSFLAYVNYETYATAVCAKMETQFNLVMYAAAFGPMVIWVKKTYSGEPQLFKASPSVILTDHERPVAVSGPAPVLTFDESGAMLPRVGPPE